MRPFSPISSSQGARVDYSGRKWRLWEHALQVFDEPRAATRNPGRPASNGRSGSALSSSRMRGSSVCRMQGIHIPRGSQRGEAEDRRLPLHHSSSEPRRSQSRGYGFRPGGHPRSDRGCPRRRGDRRPLSWSHRALPHIFIFDITEADVARAYRTVRGELRAYGADLDRKRKSWRCPMRRRHAGGCRTESYGASEGSAEKVAFAFGCFRGWRP